jgi:hypothetical protein
MEKTSSESSEENMDSRKGLFHLLGNFDYIETLMVPMEINGNHPRVLLLDIIKDGEIVIFNPFHSCMNDLGGDLMTLEKIGQSIDSHG